MSASGHEGVYEMLWDCKYCGQKKLLGLTHRHCAGCGAPQDPSARYYPSDEDKVAVKDHAFTGADVHCPACRAASSSQARCCTQCGSSLDGGAAVERKADAVRPDAHPGAAWSASGVAKPGLAVGAQGHLAFRGPVPAAAPQASSGPSTAKWIAIGVAVCALLCAVVLAFAWKRGAGLEVTGHEWSRSIDVEANAVVEKTAWCDELPAGARPTSKRRAERSKKQVKDGEDCSTRRIDQGNGTFKETKECTPRYKSEPVYDDKCTFEVEEWRVRRSVDASGKSASPEPRWPEVALSRPGACVGCERAGARRERYVVHFREPKTGEDRTCEVPQSEWTSFRPGSKYEARVGVVSGSLDCASLKAR